MLVFVPAKSLRPLRDTVWQATHCTLEPSESSDGTGLPTRYGSGALSETVARRMPAEVVDQ